MFRLKGTIEEANQEREIASIPKKTNNTKARLTDLQERIVVVN